MFLKPEFPFFEYAAHQQKCEKIFQQTASSRERALSNICRLILNDDRGYDNDTVALQTTTYCV